MFFPLGTMSIHSMTGQKLWFNAVYLGLGAVLQDGTQLEGPIFAVDDEIYMLYAGAGNTPSSCFVQFIRLDEPGTPVVIDTAEVILKSLQTAIDERAGKPALVAA